MILYKAAKIPFLAAALILVTQCTYAAPTDVVSPAFLDAPNSITVFLDHPAAPAALQGRVAVTCGGQAVPVARIAAVPYVDKKTEVVLAGTFQSALGGSDWDTGSDKTRLIEELPGVYATEFFLPEGSYQFKIARGGTWDDNYGGIPAAPQEVRGGNLQVPLQKSGPNIPLITLSGGAEIYFRVDFNARTLTTRFITENGGPAVPNPAYVATSRLMHVLLARPLGPADIDRPISITIDGQPPRTVYARGALSDPRYFYGGPDLGATYTRAATTFKVWSPVSSHVDALLYRSASAPAYRRVPLRRGASGVWSAAASGDLSGVYYQYAYTSYGSVHIAPDIYGRAASADLQRTMVVDLARTNPAGWAADLGSPRLAAPTDAVVYEAHIRDFTIDPSSGVPAAERGKYLGVAAPNTTILRMTAPTGLDYLKRLGVTDLHLLPFQSIAQHRTPGYNWGYETFLFDVPEPRYGQTPSDPSSVIRNVKTMVLGLHHAKIGLVMDVVYNHAVPAGGYASPFWAAAPYYYFRTAPNGDLLDESGVGNAVDDDHPIVRKYICESLAYWESQYHIDGFRFDLLGMFEPDTVRAISDTLHKLRPDILLYGEPWTGGGPTRFGKGAQKGLGAAVFNDNFRNAVRGDLNGTVPGFALGGRTDPVTLRTAISGSPDFTQSPTESMNYVSIHDDTALWDKITKTLPDQPALERQALKFAGAVVLLSQGVPILEGGAEMGRTKQGDSNSYNAGDAVNRFDWTRGLRFMDVSACYRSLIALRRAHPAFRCATADLVRETLSFLPHAGLPAGTIAFTLDGRPTGDSWRKILVVLHGSTAAASIALPPGRWRIAEAGAAPPPNMADRVTVDSTLRLSPLSAYVLYQP